MATLSCDSDPDPKSDVVFIDTNLHTHLALLVSHLDTVSHLKKRILSEHPLCFPKIGQIQIHAVKVKRKGYFYHLSDSMFVRSAFNGFNKSWFLSVDASALGEHGQNEQLLSPGSSNQVGCLAIANNALIGPVDNAINSPSKRVSTLNNFQLPQSENKQDEKEEVPFVSPCVSEHTGKEAVKNLETGVKSSGNNDSGIPLPGSIPETQDHCYVNHELPSSHMECEVDGSSKGTTKDDCNVREEEPSISVPSAKKKWKSKRKKQDEEEEIPVVSPCVSEHTKNEVVKNMEMGVKSSGNNDPGIPLPGSIPETQDHCRVNHELPSSHIECEVDGSSKGIKDDCIVREEGTSKSVPSAKKKRKSKRKKEDTVQVDTSKANDASVDNPLSFPSKKVSSFNNFQVPQLENKQDEEEEIPVASPCVSEHTEKVVKNVEMGVKSSGNNDPGIPLPGSIPETQDHCRVIVNHELPSSHIECEVDGSSKGIKDDCIVHEEGTSKSVPSAKKKRKSKRKKEDTVQVDTSKENDASVVGPGNDTVQQGIVVQANPSENTDKEVITETEVLKGHQHTESNNNNTKNDVDEESMKEASEAGPAANKKHRKRKRSLTDNSREMLKVETASQNDEAQKSDEAHKESKESKDQFEFNNDKSRDDVQFKHNKVTEDISDTRPPAKKKQKGKEKSGDKSLSKENASHHFLEDQQKIKNSSDDQSAEHFNDTDPLRTSVLGVRRKGKKNSSNLHETPVVTSSRRDYEADRSSIQGEGVQEEISEDGLFSKDISMNKTTIDNMEIGTDACKEGIGSKLHPSDVNEPKELTEDNANIVLDHSHKSEAGQSEGAEEGREVSPQNDPKPMLLEKCPPSNQDNTDTNIRELNVTSKVVDENGMTEPVKSEKKKRGIRKAKDSGGGPALRGHIGLVDASENETIVVKSLKATNCDPTSGNTETEENPLNQTEGKNMRQEEMKVTVLSATDKEDGFSADNAGSLEQIKTTDNAEHVDKRQRKKSNNKQTSTSKSVSNSAMSSIGENRKPHANVSGKSMDLEKRRERIPISNLKLEGSKKKVQNKAGKASGRNVGGVVSKTQQKKSLLAGAIFKDDSSGTSEDEVDNSDASTRTPSDNSLLSDFSDGDSNAGLDSQQNGSHGGKRLENGGRSALKASLSGTKGMSIDHILRSSSRYKMAKITASQSEGTESQPEFVPDSLADM